MKSSKATESVKYDVKVTRAKQIKETFVVFDATVNGISINGMKYNEYTTKKGKEGTMITFPNYENNGEYWNHVWFPITNELKDDIITQLEKLL